MKNTSKPLIIFHFDLNYVSLRTDYIRKWLAIISKMGYNAVLWELEDKVRWDTCPECVWPEAMSKEEFKDILDYSRKLGLEPIPLLQTVGHAEYVLLHSKYHSYRELPDHHDCYCTSNPDVRKFLKKWISEYLALFGDLRYFHLGGDEAYVFGKCPKCSGRIKETGANHLMMEHLSDLSEEIMAKGVRPGMWCDMILGNPDQVEKIPKDFVIWDWNYWDKEGIPESVMLWHHGSIRKEDIDGDIFSKFPVAKNFPEIIDANGKLVSFYTVDTLKRLGYDVILCSASRSHGDSLFCPAFERHALNVAGAARKALKTGILGTCVTSWAIRLNCLETQELCIAAAPAVFKNPKTETSKLLENLVAERFGNPESSKLLEALKLIGSGVSFGAAGTTGVQWRGGKDSVPAPKDHVAKILKDWTEKGILESKREELAKTFERTVKGLAMLYEFASKAGDGHEYLEYWSTAATLQFWQMKVGLEMLRGNKNSDAARIVPELKKSFLEFLLRWENPQSAKKNAGLAFDPMAEYFT